MFSKEHRLSHQKDIMRVIRKGSSVFDRACGVKFRQNETDTTRFAVVVGTKVHKRAVKRNRVKRQYREILRTHIEQIQPGYDIVLLTSKVALELDYKEKKERLMGVLKKGGLLI